MLDFEPDWIVAMGGGSPIDAAKAMWIKYEYPDISFEDMCKVFGIPSTTKESTFLCYFFNYQVLLQKLLHSQLLQTTQRVLSILLLTLKLHLM